jgi:anthranilate phosphoribosyltransferase
MFGVCVRVYTDKSPLVDTCGSGGDRSDTFNISTASSFVTAGSGIYVAKHGNRSVTSKSGAADVLEKLGVNIQLTSEEARKCLDRAGVAFLFAPLYHPAMKYVMPVRKEIGVRTLFNILGPIVNPAGVRHHVMGVYSMNLLDLIPPVFANLGHEHSMVLHGEIGIDEASIEGRTFIKEIRDGRITDNILDAKDYSLAGKLRNIRVDSPEESAEVILNVLKGKEKGDPRKAVILNAGLAIYIAKDIPIASAFSVAEQSIDSGKALKALQDLIFCSNNK